MEERKKFICTNCANFEVTGTIRNKKTGKVLRNKSCIYGISLNNLLVSSCSNFKKIK